MLAVRFESAVLAEVREWSGRLSLLQARQRTIRNALRSIVDGTMPLPAPTRPEPPCDLTLHKRQSLYWIRELQVRGDRMRDLEKHSWMIVLGLRRLMDGAAFIDRCQE